MAKLKKYLTTVLEFTTGLDFYGLGLLASGVAVWALFGWSLIGSGLIGAFVFKNFKAIVDHVKTLIKRKEV